MKKTLILTTALISFVASSIAFAQSHGMKAADTNKDGNLTRAELSAHVGKRFAKLDKDGDGSITKEERKAARADRRAERFAKLDTDGNGSLSPEEFQVQTDKYHGKGGKKGGKHHGRHAKLDANQDGVIDKAEFEARAFKRFDRIDTNNDDVVSAQERQAAYAKHKKHGPKAKPE
ncbi:MAG: hypothetical protein ABJ081_00920 [Hyphomicrobiales bacterium]